jgi:hypothetical protein
LHWEEEVDQKLGFRSHHRRLYWILKVLKSNVTPLDVIRYLSLIILFTSFPQLQTLQFTLDFAHSHQTTTTPLPRSSRLTEGAIIDLLQVLRTLHISEYSVRVDGSVDLPDFLRWKKLETVVAGQGQPSSGRQWVLTFLAQTHLQNTSVFDLDDQRARNREMLSPFFHGRPPLSIMNPVAHRHLPLIQTNAIPSPQRIQILTIIVRFADSNFEFPITVRKSLLERPTLLLNPSRLLRSDHLPKV